MRALHPRRRRGRGAEGRRWRQPGADAVDDEPTAKGATRRWTSLDDFVQEVSDARIYAGIHYRASTDAGVEMGRRIGELAAKRLATPGQ